MSCTVLVTGCGGSAVVLSNSAATRSSGCPAAFAELAGDLADRLACEVDPFDAGEQFSCIPSRWGGIHPVMAGIISAV
jgi:hypothetical protein